jgi:hypothetical protein
MVSEHNCSTWVSNAPGKGDSEHITYTSESGYWNQIYSKEPIDFARETSVDITLDACSGDGDFMFGFGSEDAVSQPNVYTGRTPDSWAYYSTGSIFHAGVSKPLAFDRLIPGMRCVLKFTKEKVSFQVFGAVFPNEPLLTADLLVFETEPACPLHVALSFCEPGNFQRKWLGKEFSGTPSGSSLLVKTVQTTPAASKSVLGTTLVESSLFESCVLF